MWYLFQTITTIGFGDVIARSGYCENEDYEGQDLDNITNAVYWVSIELLESTSCTYYRGGRMDIHISSLLLGGEDVFLTHSSEFHGSKLDQEVRTDAEVHSQHV